LADAVAAAACVAPGLRALSVDCGGGEELSRWRAVWGAAAVVGIERDAALAAVARALPGWMAYSSRWPHCPPALRPSTPCCAWTRPTTSTRAPIGCALRPPRGSRLAAPACYAALIGPARRRGLGYALFVARHDRSP